MFWGENTVAFSQVLLISNLQATSPFLVPTVHLAQVRNGTDAGFRKAGLSTEVSVVEGLHGYSYLSSGLVCALR